MEPEKTFIVMSEQEIQDAFGDPVTEDEAEQEALQYLVENTDAGELYIVQIKKVVTLGVRIKDFEGF